MAQVIESKRKKGTVKLVIGALIFGVAAAGFTYLYLRIKEHDLREALRERDTRKVPVVVAKQDLPQGAPVNSDTMAVRRIPAELAYPDVVTPNTFDSVENNFLSKPLAAGTPLLKTFLEEEVARDFSDTIPLGRRAMTIQVDEINSVGGFIRPGNRVDLYARLPAEAKGPDATDDQDRIVPLLQKVEVLATGRDAASDYQAKYIEVSGGNRNAFTYTTLTVNVSPEQAALLATGQDKGDLVALLRNRDDKGRALFEEITPRDIFEHSATQAGKARAQKAAASLDNARKLQKGDLVVKDGVVTTADGKPVDNLVAHPDGTVTTKDGRLVMNADGTMAEGAMVTPDGKVVANPNLRVKDGTVMTKDGVVLSGRGLRVNGDGELVDEDGRVVDPESLKATKNGQIITADGEVLEDTSTVVTADGKSLAPGDVHVTRDGFLATEEGTVMTSDGTVLKGAKLTDDGRVVAADGTVLTPDTIQTNGDGTVTRRTEETVAGVQAEKAMDAD
ncbi:MAG TPA: Flp pilus assembly protein CpaB, partial [Gammaproteobacteria bacterium]|nr:Flp pilus assembly protein CpaB [Gammaproteobacteria bacterium]